MRRLLLLLILIFLVGCAVTSDALISYDACIRDVVCSAKMQSIGVSTQSVVNSVSSDYGVIASIVGMITSAISGVIYGRKLRKKGVAK